MAVLSSLSKGLPDNRFGLKYVVQHVLIAQSVSQTFVDSIANFKCK